MNPIWFTLAMSAGTILFPTQLPSGPRLTDTRTTTSSVGGPVPIAFGTCAVAGTVIWLAPFVEHKSEQGGKGGPQQLQYNYTQSIAIALCERVDDFAPDNEGAIGGISRIWENGTIVYDIRPQQLASSTGALDLLAETDQQYQNRLTASAAYAETFTLYLGDELQLADPTIEAVEGAGNVPAFRALAYIVYPNRNLQLAQGQRHPNFQFEVYPWPPNGEGAPAVSPIVPALLLNFNGSNGSTVFTDSSPAHHIVTALGDAHLDTTSPLPGHTAALRTNFFDSNEQCASIAVTPGGPLDLSTSDDFTLQFWLDFDLPPSAGGTPVLASWYAGGDGWYMRFIQTFGVAGYFEFKTLHAGADTWQQGSSGGAGITLNQYTLVEVVCQGGVMGLFVDGVAGKTANGAPPHAVTILPPAPGTKLQIGSNQAWVAQPIHGFYGKVAITRAALHTPGVDYGGGPPPPFVGTVTLGQIIGRICKRSGLTAIDVTDMDAISINGYAIATVCSGSAILTPLRSVGFFDAVETEAVLKFLARGKPIVATLTTDDFGAYDATANGDPSKCPPSIATQRVQDVELPFQIRLHYMATSRDYQDAEQDSEFRLSTKATNPVDVSLPLCLDDTQALQCANVLWAAAWASRSSHTLSVDQAWLNLDLADCIGVPIDGVIQRLRIVSDTLASGVLRKLSCVRDDGGAYISFAVAAAPARSPLPLTFVAPASFELLDLPCLQDSDSDPGFYVAAQRLNGVGAWKGASIYKSIDGGSTYTLVSTVITEAALGTLGSAVAPSQAFTWDTTTLIDVTVASNAITFEGRSDAAVLAGANAAAMGADGRWEIVQFAIATQIDPTHWQLSRLLRGRRGTEHVMGTSQVGDTFVLVSGGDLARIVLQSTEIGALRDYQVAAIGLPISSAVTQAFTGHGQALVCFSPVDAIADLQSDGDILISWIRRSRLGRTLMSGVDIPLGEATESFSVDILEAASPHTVLRTLASSTVSVLYTHAMQETDFGSPLPATLDVAIYQLSAITGRGTPLLVTLTIT